MDSETNRTSLDSKIYCFNDKQQSDYLFLVAWIFLLVFLQEKQKN